MTRSRHQRQRALLDDATDAKQPRSLPFGVADQTAGRHPPGYVHGAAPSPAAENVGSEGTQKINVRDVLYVLVSVRRAYELARLLNSWATTYVPAAQLRHGFKFKHRIAPKRKCHEDRARRLEPRHDSHRQGNLPHACSPSRWDAAAASIIVTSGIFVQGAIMATVGWVRASWANGQRGALMVQDLLCGTVRSPAEQRVGR